MAWGSKTAQPTVRQIYIAQPGSQSGGLLTPARQYQGESGGFSVCGLCRCCTCIQLGFLKTPTAAVKIIELGLGLVCQLLLLQYGMKYGKDLGAGYSIFLTTTSACLLTTCVLLLCYVTSGSTYTRVRPSLFEVLFNYVACALYLGASSILATSVQMNLYYFYQTIPGFSAYPAMTATYVLGYIVGIVHGVDASMALKFMRTQR